MRSLYLRIYVTVVAVLLVFALVTAWFGQFHLEREREQLQSRVSEQIAANATVIERSLPPPEAPAAEQREALLGWARQLRLPLALDDAQGERIAESPEFAQRELEGTDLGRRTVRVELSDGRTLWLWRQLQRRTLLGQDAGPDGGPPPLDRLDPPEVASWIPLPPPWMIPGGRGGGFALTLGILFVAVALGAYPVVRRLTRRLEALKRGVEAFGSGQLTQRVKDDGRDEVAAVGRSFNRAAARIEALVTSHRNLLANASHELRSPLARLKMALAMLDTASPTSRISLRGEIDHNIRELDALVDEVLLASRLEARRDDEARDPVELLPLAAEEAARLDATVGGDDVAVIGSERLLRRALRNLLENAARYGGGSPPEVEIHREPNAPTVRVAVCDRGPGVPAAERDRIFEPFYRLPGHAEQAGGVGLGLSLVRQIATRHGGEVHVEDRDGGGSRFVLTLPIAA